MGKIFRNNLVFLIPFLLYFLTGVVVYCIYSKSDIHLFLNQFNSPFWDRFFVYYTFMGSGFITLGVMLYYCFIRFRDAMFILVGFIFTGIVTHVLKNFFFSDVVRPVLHFREVAELHLVDGLDMLTLHSFPSGHTTAAFALFFAWSVLVHSRVLKLLFVLLALATAYSRIYLSQHFLIDTLAGSFIGVFFTLLAYFLVYQWKKAWLDKRLKIILEKA